MTMYPSAPTIWLIDDDPDDAEFITFTLQKNVPPIDIFHIGDGEMALKCLFDDGQIAPGLILLDLRMPKVDGIHVLRRLKADPDRRRIPVIVLVSSLDAGRSYVESFGLSADGYLAKPVGIEQFLKVLDDAGLTWPG